MLCPPPEMALIWLVWLSTGYHSVHLGHCLPEHAFHALWVDPGSLISGSPLPHASLRQGQPFHLAMDCLLASLFSSLPPGQTEMGSP